MPWSGMHDQPERAQSFGDRADAYDRFRAGYPSVVAVDRLANLSVLHRLALVLRAEPT